MTMIPSQIERDILIEAPPGLAAGATDQLSADDGSDKSPEAEGDPGG
jgi:hypothetical protein